MIRNTYYRLNWARGTSWGWWDEWDDIVLQTQDSRFKPWWSEAEHATSRSRWLPAILSFRRGWGKNIFVSFKPPRPGTEPRALAWKAAVLTTTLGSPPIVFTRIFCSAKPKGSICLLVNQAYAAIRSSKTNIPIVVDLFSRNLRCNGKLLKADEQYKTQWQWWKVPALLYTMSIQDVRINCSSWTTIKTRWYGTESAFYTGVLATTPAIIP